VTGIEQTDDVPIDCYSFAATAVAETITPKTGPLWERVMLGGMAGCWYDGTGPDAARSLASGILKAQVRDARKRNPRAKLIAKYELQLQRYLTNHWDVVTAIAKVIDMHRHDPVPIYPGHLRLAALKALRLKRRDWN
jgi:hypothetical protein